MTYALKTPTIFDVYEGEYPVKFAQMNPKPLANIFRASWQKLGSRVRGIDTKAVEYVTTNRTLGIKCGLYHFLTPNGIAEQAALFLSQWNKVGGVELAPIVDVEVDLAAPFANGGYAGTVGNAVWQGHIKTFLDLIASGTGRTPIIYTNRNFWSFAMTKQGVLQQLAPPVWTKDYYLWLGWYPTYPDNFSAPPASVMPAGWDKWALWQWEDGGRQNGYLANDLNIPSDWYALELGLANPPPPDPPPPVPVAQWPEKLVAHRGTETKDYFHA
jgi:GH25 family lysozyme M1 (1,4-beta-N-acetylmuramidase)